MISRLLIAMTIIPTTNDELVYEGISCHSFIITKLIDFNDSK